MSVAPALKPLEIDRVASRLAMAEFLSRDRLLAAYALADLDECHVAAARWWLARRGGQAIAAALVMTDLAFRPLFVTGDGEGVAHLLRHAIREPRVVASAPPEARPAVESVYRLERAERMLRMVVGRDTYRPSDTKGVVRLGAEHLDAVIDLYGVASRSYFTPPRLQEELYFGVYADDTLVAAAGTHVRSREFGVAAVGNVLTRVPYRNRGLARACTAAVTEAALEEHRDVVLNVREDNASAIAVYRRLDYRVHRSFIEGPAYRRPMWERVISQIFHVPSEGDDDEDSRT